MQISQKSNQNFKFISNENINKEISKSLIRHFCSACVFFCFGYIRKNPNVSD